MKINSSHFAKGHTPWNKGTKGICKPNGGSFRKGQFENEKHPSWKGDKVSYWGLHIWIKRKLGNQKFCDLCFTKKSKRFEWANVSGEYKRGLNDWVRLCSICHHFVDNITIRGWETRRRKKLFV